MPTVNVHTPPADRNCGIPFPLPPLLETPMGIALLEIQGTINFPSPSASSTTSSSNTNEAGPGSTDVGRIEFPDYDASLGAQEGAWMRRVWLFVGHQRLTGEVKALNPPVGLLRKRERRETAEAPDELGTSDTSLDDESMADSTIDSEGLQDEERNPDSTRAAPGKEEELEILEIVKWKMVFRSRPEPVGSLED